MSTSLFKHVVEIEKEAEDFGFSWESSHQIMQQIRSECDEIDQHLRESSASHPASLQEELGDLLHAACSLTIFCGCDPEQTLDKAVTKFKLRFLKVKELAHTAGLQNLASLSFQEKMQLWDQAKQRLDPAKN